jgi:type 1 glutamine amidotransferase
MERMTSEKKGRVWRRGFVFSAMVICCAALLLVGLTLWPARNALMTSDDVFETSPPHFSTDLGPSAILIFTKTNGFRDEAGIEAAVPAIKAIAKRRGWSIFHTENAAIFNERDLSRFKMTIWVNTSGNILLTNQRYALRQFVEQGGGFFGIHGAGGDYSYDWRWYVEKLIGAQFTGHTGWEHIQPATLIVERRDTPATQMLPAKWQRSDEWYSFAKSPRAKVDVLISIDELSYSPRMMRSIAMGDHPMVWTHCIGKGRVFYSALGHTPESYAERLHLTMIEGAIAWTAGVEGERCSDAKIQGASDFNKKGA